jgi:hypothetical protein
MTTPLHTVKEKFGSKEQLVDQLVGMVQRRADETDSELKNRLMRVSNRKLVTLHQREELLKNSHGNRDKLITALVEKKLGRSDADLQAKLSGYTTGRLLSMGRSL